MTEIEKIELDQKRRFQERKRNMYQLLDKKTRKQIVYLSEKLKFMFKNDGYGQLTADIQVFQTVSSSPLTLDSLQHQILTNGQKAARSNITIEDFLNIIKSEAIGLNARNEVRLSAEQQLEFNKRMKDNLNSLMLK